MSKTGGIANAHIVEPFGARTGTINLSEIAAQELLGAMEEHRLLEKDTIIDLETWNYLLGVCTALMTNIVDFKIDHTGTVIHAHSNRAKLTIRAVGVEPAKPVVRKLHCVLETKVRGNVSATGKVVDVSTIDGVKELFTALVQL